jgi:hypothetical protein
MVEVFLCICRLTVFNRPYIVAIVGMRGLVDSDVGMKIVVE